MKTYKIIKHNMEFGPSIEVYNKQLDFFYAFLDEYNENPSYFESSTYEVESFEECVNLYCKDNFVTTINLDNIVINPVLIYLQDKLLGFYDLGIEIKCTNICNKIDNTEPKY